MSFTAYILRSLKDRRYYIGQTSDFVKRLYRHQDGLERSTKHRSPFEVVWTEEYGTRSEALERETYLKALKGGNEFKKLIANRSMRES